MWILAALLLIAGAGVFILWPYLRARPVVPGAQVDVDPRLLDLYDQRDMLYGAVRDARLDLETGKLSQDDFEQQDGRLRQQAATVLRSIDDIEQSMASPQLDALVEAEISAAREAPAPVRLAPGADDDAVEAAIAGARRRNGASSPAVRADRYCGHCGGPLKTGDRFCGRCGQATQAG